MSFLSYLEVHEVAVMDMIDEAADHLTKADDIDIYVDEEDNVYLWVMQYIDGEDILDAEVFQELGDLVESISAVSVIDSFCITNEDSLNLTLEYILELY